MQFYKSITLATLVWAAVAVAAPAETIAATDAVSSVEGASPVSDISNGVGIITYAGKNCGGKNQGTTLDYGGNKCVNWSNAGSFKLEFGTLGGCANGNKATIHFHHNTGCAGGTYSTQTVGGGCRNLNAVSGGHGSGTIVC